MRIDETYNIHKKISCIFPHFRSKYLCSKGKHNYQIKERNLVPYWECACCGKIEEFN